MVVVPTMAGDPITLMVVVPTMVVAIIGDPTEIGESSDTAELL
jgi:enhancing lycopene biosynthesis protein 2